MASDGESPGKAPGDPYGEIRALLTSPKSADLHGALELAGGWVIPVLVDHLEAGDVKAQLAVGTPSGGSARTPSARSWRGTTPSRTRRSGRSSPTRSGRSSPRTSPRRCR